MTDQYETAEALSFLKFWLDAGPSKWFSGGDKFDKACAVYEPLWERAKCGKLDEWAQTASGSLALIILLDQIPRNIFRGQAKQFETDAKALDLSKRAIEAGFDQTQIMPLQNFFYLPFMHSEDLSDQQKGCDLLRVLGSREHYYFALVHMDAIVRFGRFPHRNKILGRESTENERLYLRTGGFGA